MPEPRIIIGEQSLAAVEAERHRLALELEAGVVESLNLLLAQANMYEQSLAGDPLATMAVSVLASLARQALQQVRDLTASLQPTILTDLGLEPALEWLAAQITRSYGVRVVLALQRLRERLPAPVELALFRATQETLDGIVRSGQAQAVRVAVAAGAGEIVVQIGYQSRVPLQPEVGPAVRARIELVGGHVTLEAGDGQEVLVALHVPFPEPINLTPRERDVLRSLAAGLSNKAIAAALQISPRTVNFHLDHIYAKLGVSSRTEAVIYALRNAPEGDPVR